MTCPSVFFSALATIGLRIVVFFMVTSELILKRNHLGGYFRQLFLLIRIQRDPAKWLKIRGFSGYPQLWITLCVTTLIFLYQLAT